MNSNYIDLSTRIKKDFSEINSNIVMDLYKTNKQYAELQNDVSKLKKQYPFIDRIIEESGEMNLSAQEHNILIQYFQLSRQMENMERKHIYFCGQKDIIAYLKELICLTRWEGYLVILSFMSFQKCSKTKSCGKS